MNSLDEIAVNPYKIQETVYDNFNWEVICDKIIEKIEE
jgi:hypothetical protein